MTETWFACALRLIQQADAALPETTDIKMRRKAIRAARPYEYRATSHGQKSWAEATKVYLQKVHGVLPRQHKVNDGELPLFTSPLDRQRARAKRLHLRVVK